MTRFLALAILSLFVFTSCGNKTETEQQHVSKYYDDGRARPVVAVGTVIDSTSYDLPWSLSEELTHLVQKQLSTNQNIFLASTDEIDEFLTNSDNPFDANVSWMKDRFEPNEFLVFLELINHNELKKDSITNLDMTVRIRIVDVRTKKPRVILQECLKDNYYIAKGSIKEDYQSTVWGSNEYDNSRMGMAHKQLAKDIADRISDYIALSKSR
jgi:hypothetical protein